MRIIGLMVLLGIFIVISKILGGYFYKLIFYKSSKIDFIMDKIDNFIYKLGGIKGRDMNWKQYGLAMLLTNALMILIGFVILLFQGILTNGEKGLTLDLIFNIVSSFMTNTNLQNYTGEVNLTNLSQMIVITVFMFTSAATGFSVLGACIRGLTDHKIGNFFKDLVRIITRFLIPAAFLMAIFFISEGVPQTFESSKTIETIEGSTQTIAYGPVASLESIKHLGTNGGGFFGGNSAHPFENPTPLTNLVQMLGMMVVPGAYIFMFGKACKNKKQGRVIFISVFALLLVSLAIMILGENIGTPVLNDIGIQNTLGNMEGKEVRFGAFDSSVFSVITTSFTTGSVNNMHESLTPIGIFITTWNMMLNTIFGGKGVGLINILIFSILGVFICGLMIGRTPEFLRKKIEGREMKLISAIILIHPIIILVPTAIALLFGQNSQEGFHGVSQILYEYTSAAANNGSALEGLKDSTIFFNLTTGIVMLFGRFISLILMLALAGGLKKKRKISEESIGFRTDTFLFGGILIVTILIIGALTFLPALVLGPITEILML
ncbi:MAG: potassium-transporting ATPase subunit KdpA [Clostridium sp.]